MNQQILFGITLVIFVIFVQLIIIHLVITTAKETEEEKINAKKQVLRKLRDLLQKWDDEAEKYYEEEKHFSLDHRTAYVSGMDNCATDIAFLADALEEEIKKIKKGY